MENQKIKRVYKIINIHPEYESNEAQNVAFKEMAEDIIPEIYRLVNLHKQETNSQS